MKPINYLHKVNTSSGKLPEDIGIYFCVINSLFYTPIKFFNTIIQPKKNKLQTGLMHVAPHVNNKITLREHWHLFKNRPNY